MKRKIWFTSDQHYYHKNVIPYCGRPFVTHIGELLNKTKEPTTIAHKEAMTLDVLEMNEELIRRHNVLVKDSDVVLHLGDFSLWKHGPAEILPRLSGEHHLIAGNHDWCHPVQAKKPEKIAKFRELYLEAGFESIALEGRIEVDSGLTLRMHHMPYLMGDASEDVRYRELRPVDDGSWLLHGHVHNSWKVRERCINVGVDQWSFAPVSLGEIVELIKNNS